MNLRTIILAALCATIPTKRTVAEENPIPQSSADLQPDLIYVPPRNPAQVALRIGRSSIDGAAYKTAALTLTPDRFFIEIGYSRELNPRRQEDTIALRQVEVGGAGSTDIIIRGQRRSWIDELRANIGYDVQSLRIEQNYFRFVPSWSMVGGLTMESSDLSSGHGRIPRGFKVDFFGGLGLRARAVYPFSHFTHLPILEGIEMGVGASLEYRIFDLTTAEPRNPTTSYNAEVYAMLIWALKGEEGRFISAPR